MRQSALGNRKASFHCPRLHCLCIRQYALGTLKTSMDIFKIRKKEIAVFAIGITAVALLNFIMTGYRNELFTRGGNLGFWSIFYDHFSISGYDPFMYITISRWKIYYVLSRHPLLTPMLYPFALLNGWLMSCTGYNYAIYIIAAVYSLLGAYSFLFTYRIMRGIIGICALDSLLTTLFFFSLGHIAVACFVPDHFAVSLFFITLTAYISGTYIRQRRSMPSWAVAILATLTAGVTVTNVAKTWLAAIWANGKSFWSPKSLLVSVLLPTAVLGGGYWLQYEFMSKPDHEIQARNIEKKLKTDAKFAKKYHERQKWLEQRRSFNNTDNTVLEWVDTKTDRWDTVVENLLGESLQIHKDNLLDDTNVSRPVIVAYRGWYNYAVEAIIAAMFAAGIIAGRKNKFCLMVMSWCAVDMTIHMLLGFALTEVYIMTAHWALAIPVAIGCLLSRHNGKRRIALRSLLLALTVWLISWNVPLIIEKVWHM